MKHLIISLFLASVCFLGRAQVVGEREHDHDGGRGQIADKEGDGGRESDGYGGDHDHDLDLDRAGHDDDRAGGHDDDDDDDDDLDRAGHDDALDLDRAGHDHAGHGHNPADETPGALFEDMADAIAAQPGQRVLYSFTGFAPRFGLAVQKSLFAEVGLSLDFYQLGYTGASEYVSFGYSNLRPYLAGEIMVGRKLLGGGKMGVEYIRSTPILGMAFGADASYMTDGEQNAVMITPRLMLSFVTVELFYGYNIFVRNDLARWIGRHRIGVSMTLNRRFWKRKKAIYEDYYNSYLEE